MKTFLLVLLIPIAIVLFFYRCSDTPYFHDKGSSVETSTLIESTSDVTQKESTQATQDTSSQTSQEQSNENEKSFHQDRAQSHLQKNTQEKQPTDTAMTQVPNDTISPELIKLQKSEIARLAKQHALTQKVEQNLQEQIKNDKNVAISKLVVEIPTIKTEDTQKEKSPKKHIEPKPDNKQKSEIDALKIKHTLAKKVEQNLQEQIKNDKNIPHAKLSSALQKETTSNKTNKNKQDTQAKLTNTFLHTKISFYHAQSTLNKKGKSSLKAISALMKLHPQFHYRIEGHTDKSGHEQINLSLSQARAESVKAFLIQQGIDSKILEPKGFGSSQPIASNKTQAGRMKNRRVLIQVLAQGE